MSPKNKSLRGKSLEDELPTLPPDSALVAKMTIEKATNDFLNEYEGESADPTMRMDF